MLDDRINCLSRDPDFCRSPVTSSRVAAARRRASDGRPTTDANPYPPGPSPESETSLDVQEVGFTTRTSQGKCATVLSSNVLASLWSVMQEGYMAAQPLPSSTQLEADSEEVMYRRPNCRA